MQRPKQRDVQRPDPAPTDPAEDEQTPPPSSSDEADAGLTVQQVEALIAKAKNSGRMTALSEMRWNREVQAQGETSGVDVDPTQILKGAGQQGSLLLLRRALDGVPDPRLATLEAQNRELQNRLQQIETQQLVAKQFEQLRADMEQKLEAKIPTTTSAGPAADNSSSFGKEIAEAFIQGMKVAREFTVNPFEVTKQALETVKQYSSIADPNPIAVDLKRLDLAQWKYAQDRADTFAIEKAKIEATREEQQKFRELLDLGRQGVMDLMKPVSEAAGRAVEARIAGVPPVPTAPPTQISPEQLAHAKQILEHQKAVVTENERRLQEMERVAGSQPLPQEIRSVGYVAPPGTTAPATDSASGSIGGM